MGVTFIKYKTHIRIKDRPDPASHDYIFHNHKESVYMKSHQHLSKHFKWLFFSIVSITLISCTNTNNSISQNLNITVPLAHKSNIELIEYPESADITQILQSKEMPNGVIFHVMVFDDNGFEELLPRLKQYTRQLRKNDPEFKIAIVAHGDEIRGLYKKNTQYKATQDNVVKFLKENLVSLHVCGAYLSINHLTEYGFDKEIDVVPFGPSQIKDYIEVGYTPIGLSLD